MRPDIQDHFAGGFLPLRHEDKSYDVSCRLVRYACRPGGGSDSGAGKCYDQYGALRGETELNGAQNTYGDILGFGLWDAATRSIPGWSSAWASTLVSSSHAIPAFDSDFGPDLRFETKLVGLPTYLGKLPTGVAGTTTVGTNEYSQEDVFLPAGFGPMVAVNAAGEPNCGSRVYDLTDSDALDPQRYALLQSMMRVVKTNDAPKASLAWQLGTSQQDKLDGYGLMYGNSSPRLGPLLSSQGLYSQDQYGNTIYTSSIPGGLGGFQGSTRDAGSGGNTTTSTTVVANTPNTQTGVNPVGVIERAGFTPPPVIAYASSDKFGPVDLGEVDDAHFIRECEDGAINSSHISTNAYFRGQGSDAPFNFESVQYQDPGMLPYLSRGHIQCDYATQHDFLLGPRDGKWKILCEYNYYRDPAITIYDDDDDEGGDGGGTIDGGTYLGGGIYLTPGAFNIITSSGSNAIGSSTIPASNRSSALLLKTQEQNAQVVAPLPTLPNEIAPRATLSRAIADLVTPFAQPAKVGVSPSPSGTFSAVRPSAGALAPLSLSAKPRTTAPALYGRAGSPTSRSPGGALPVASLLYTPPLARSAVPVGRGGWSGGSSVASGRTLSTNGVTLNSIRNQDFLSTPLEHAYGALLFRAHPPFLADLRNENAVSSSMKATFQRTSPLVGRLEAYGNFGGNSSSVVFSRFPGGGGRYSSGTSSGGLLFAPADHGAEQIASGRNPPSSLPVPSLTMWGSQLSFARPLSTGLVGDGYTMQSVGNTTWQMLWANSTGITSETPAAIYLDSGQSPVDPPPSFLIWGGQAVTVWNTTNGQAASGTVFVADGTNVGPGGTWQAASTTAVALATTGASVTVSTAAPPTTGQVLTATSATAADWQTPSSVTQASTYSSAKLPPGAVSTTETLIGGGSSFTQIPANTLKVGSIIRIRATASCGNGSASATTQSFRLRAGSAGTTSDPLVMTWVATTSATGTADYVFEAVIYVKTSGSSGETAGVATVLNTSPTTGVSGQSVLTIGGSSSSNLNTTAANYLTLTFQTNGLLTSSTFYEPVTIELTKI